MEKQQFTKFEIARILGARALQLSMDAPLLIKIDEKEKREVMKINPEVRDIFSFQFEDFHLENYQCHPSIKAPIAI